MHRELPTLKKTIVVQEAEVQKINRPKTNRRRTAKRQPGDAQNVKLRFKSRRWTRGFDQEVEEEHLTLLDGLRFETKNYACDALPARRRKPAERLREDDEWQTRCLDRGGKKQPKRKMSIHSFETCPPVIVIATLHSA